MNARSLCQVKREHGVSLLEALITIFVLAFGILGLANLHAKMQTVEVESYARSQALVLLDDMAARLSANRGVAATYVTANPTASPTGVGDATNRLFRRRSGRCATPAMDNALKGSGLGSATVSTMIGGRGCIELLAGASPPSYQVIVTWQGLSPTVAPSGVDCAQSFYSDDRFRRAVVKVVSIASLGP